MIIRFCQMQIKAKEDTENTFTCLAHIDKGRVFECPYKTREEALKANCNYMMGVKVNEAS